MLFEGFMAAIVKILVQDVVLCGLYLGISVSEKLFASVFRVMEY